MAGDKKSNDPYLAFKFWVQIDGINIAGFTECSPIIGETEVMEYAEGGLNTFTHKLPGRTKWPNITLKHGIDPGGDLLYWYHYTATENYYKKNVSIILHDHEGNAVKTYHLLDAYPVKWTSADMRADPAAVAIESIELAHCGLDLSQDKGQAPKAGASPGGG